MKRELGWAAFWPVRLALSEVLVGICSQQLLRRADGAGRVAALEVMVGTPAIRNLIREGKTHLVPNVIMTAKKEGMQLLDQHLRELVAQQLVTAEEAARFAVEPQAILNQTPGAKPMATADSR